MTASFSPLAALIAISFSRKAACRWRARLACDSRGIRVGLEPSAKGKLIASWAVGILEEGTEERGSRRGTRFAGRAESLCRVAARMGFVEPAEVGLAGFKSKSVPRVVVHEQE